MVINTHNWSAHREQETVACSVLSGGVGITSLPREAQRSLQNLAEKTVSARGNVCCWETVFACRDSAIAYVNSHWLRLHMMKPVKTQSGWRRSSANPIPPWGAINDFLGRESQFSSKKWSLRVYPCSSTQSHKHVHPGITKYTQWVNKRKKHIKLGGKSGGWVWESK